VLQADSSIQFRKSSLRRVVSGGAVVLIASASTTAEAYTYGSAVSDSCHEGLALEALRVVRSLPELQETAAPWSESDTDRLLRESLPFELPEDMKDAQAVALVLGVRDNDLKGNHETDLERLAMVHSNPDGQREHCLRRPDHDFELGSRAALAECIAYIRDQVVYAVAEGLDEDGRPRRDRLGSVVVSLPFAGAFRVDVPLFSLRIGQALHALQDSFTHTFRVPIEEDDAGGELVPWLPAHQRSRVTVVLNWVELAGGQLDERRDGPPHMTELDQCNATEPLIVRRREEAVAASVDVLRASLDPARDVDEKRAAIEAVLDSYLGYREGCTYENQWCDAPENALRAPAGCSCRFAGGAPQRAGALLSAAALGLVLARRRRRRHGMRKRCALPAAAALLAGPSLARAETIHDGVTTSSPGVDAEVDDEPERSPIGFAAGFGGALDNWALAMSLGLRGRPHDRWVLGVDAEWNPWLSTENDRFTLGSFNGYLTVIHRWPLDHAPVDLRTSLHAGVSVLLFDVWGAPMGSAGPYLGASPLGVEVPLDGQWTFLVDPIDVALAVPHVVGVPLLYPQYRLSMGFQFGG
jgi:MYXO-CTERM domain-containing protein